jgi:RimJ/RimL family protein N-acetyltransferase
MNTLIAKTSPENKDSQRVLQKCGARKGETLTDAYERWVDKGAKSDLLCWYFDRPSLIVEYENKDEGKRGANIRVSGK